MTYRRRTAINNAFVSENKYVYRRFSNINLYMRPINSPRRENRNSLNWVSAGPSTILPKKGSIWP